MIKLNTIYSTKNDYYIVVIRHPKAKWYELHSLADIRYFARKVIDGEEPY